VRNARLHERLARDDEPEPGVERRRMRLRVQRHAAHAPLARTLDQRLEHPAADALPPRLA